MTYSDDPGGVLRTQGSSLVPSGTFALLVSSTFERKYGRTQPQDASPDRPIRDPGRRTAIKRRDGRRRMSATMPVPPAANEDHERSHVMPSTDGVTRDAKDESVCTPGFPPFERLTRANAAWAAPGPAP